jgi:MbtH protein
MQGVGNVSNPFDDESGRFLVLVNPEAQYSLWPAHIDVPGGWEQVGAEGSRQECTDLIDRVWTDMRPASLVAAMESDTD